MFVYHGSWCVENNKDASTPADIVGKNYAYPMLTNDLGNGFYTYIDDEKGADGKPLFGKASENAVKFAKAYRRKRSCDPVSLYKCELFETGFVIMDMDAEQFQKLFIRNKISFQKLVDLEYEQVSEKKRTSTHGSRKNLDGLLIELLIQRKILPDVDVIKKSTYTAFRKNTLSNFPNGEEFVIRKPETVIKQHTVNKIY